jgi:hypothetical protein
MSKPKITSDEMELIVDRYRQGESAADLARAYEVHPSTIMHRLRKVGILRKKSQRSRQAQSVVDFAKRCRSVLWRQDHKHVEYKRWQRRIEELESDSGGGYTRHEAIVRASKEFNCLRKLFREYDVSLWDPNPMSHPDVPNENQIASTGVVSEGIEQSHRENLRWAIEAAGRALRTGEAPKTAPNDSAYYLYRQALDEPKDFMGKVNQIEAKGDSDADERASSKRLGQRTVAEINQMLENL